MAKKAKYYQRKCDGLFETSRTINGKRVMFRGKTCREVDQKILNYKEKQEKGRLFVEVADEWYEQKEKTVRLGSAISYATHLNKVKDYFTGYIKEITPRDVKNFVLRVEHQGYSRSSVSKSLGVVSQIMSYAVLCGDIEYSPATEVTISKNLPKKERNALTVEQEMAVEAFRGENWLYGLMLLYTGCRRGELLALSWQDVDRENGLIHINKKLTWYKSSSTPEVDHFLKSKNGKRDIPLLAPLAEVLPRNRIGIIFPGKNGYMSEYEQVKLWKNYAADVGLDGITPHCFRHSFATICYEAGVDSKTAASLLGDTEEVTQSVYQELRERHRSRGTDLLNAYFAARKEEKQA